MTYINILVVIQILWLIFKVGTNNHQPYW